MSTKEIPPNGRTTISDERGATRMPKRVIKALDIRPGDKLEWVAEDGELSVKLIPQEQLDS